MGATSSRAGARRRRRPAPPASWSPPGRRHGVPLHGQRLRVGAVERSQRRPGVAGRRPGRAGAHEHTGPGDVVDPPAGHALEVAGQRGPRQGGQRGEREVEGPAHLTGTASRYRSGGTGSTSPTRCRSGSRRCRGAAPAGVAAGPVTASARGRPATTVSAPSPACPGQPGDRRASGCASGSWGLVSGLVGDHYRMGARDRTKSRRSATCHRSVSTRAAASGPPATLPA